MTGTELITAFSPGSARTPYCRGPEISLGHLGGAYSGGEPQRRLRNASDWFGALLTGAIFQSRNPHMGIARREKFESVSVMCTHQQRKRPWPTDRSRHPMAMVVRSKWTKTTCGTLPPSSHGWHVGGPGWDHLRRRAHLGACGTDDGCTCHPPLVGCFTSGGNAFPMETGTVDRLPRKASRWRRRPSL